jgi:hypothetical protein
MRPALHVRGTVTGIPDAAPGQVVRATVTLLPDDASSFIALPIVQTQPNGAFEMEHVSPGAYTVYATAGNLQSRVSIDVRDHDVNGVDVALSTGLNLSGRVFIENPTDKVGPGSVNAVSVALVTDPALGGFLISATATASVTGPVPPGSDGTFVLPGATAAGPLPGKYRVYVPPLLVPASGWSAPRVALPQALTRTTIPPALETAYVKSIRLGDRDVLNDGLYLESSTREPLTIVIGTDAATVEGTVVDHERKPIDSATVVLVPETGLKFQTNHRYVGTDTAGRFQFKNIAPGEYRVFAWEYAAPGAWQDPDFVRSHESLGQLVRIPAAKTTTLSLTSIP